MVVKPLRTNLAKLQPSRCAPVPGDVFVYRPIGHPLYFGRVISLDADIRGMPAILIYLYSTASENSESIPPLRPGELLVPPILTNRLAWTRGYFRTLKNVPLTKWDVLPAHAFRTTMPPFLVDERGNPIRQAVEPIGQYGLDSILTIDDLVSDALGIPRVPED